MKDLPSVPSIKSLIGPSFILLGLGLGSGEFILWPYLIGNWGMGIIWGAILGVTFQFFMNMEIERYTLIYGESVFVGFAKFIKIAPFWFIVSTLVSWFWPGIIATSAQLFGMTLGIYGYWRLIGILMLTTIGLVLTLGSALYKTVEKFSMILIGVGIPFIFGLAVYLSTKQNLVDLFRGTINFGFFPEGLPIASFLAAFAFAGAGGNLNLAQSFYVKEKGYGMGRYADKISSLLSGKSDNYKPGGFSFDINTGNLEKFKKWWLFVNVEHLLVFWLGSVVSILVLSLLAYSTVFGKENLVNSVEFIIVESKVVATRVGPVVGKLFLVIGGLMLFNTQLAVLDATSRIMAENTVIIKGGTFSKKYYIYLWTQIVLGVLIFIFNLGQPFVLLTISAILNAVAMFVHIGLTVYLNTRSLDKSIRPSLFRLLMMVVAFVFFGYFSLRLLAGLW